MRRSPLLPDHLLQWRSLLLPVRHLLQMSMTRKRPVPSGRDTLCLEPPLSRFSPLHTISIRLADHDSIRTTAKEHQKINLNWNVCRSFVNGLLTRTTSSQQPSAWLSSWLVSLSSSEEREERRRISSTAPRLSLTPLRRSPDSPSILPDSARILE